MPPPTISLPNAFADVIADNIEHMLAHQQRDGSLHYENAPLAYPQQAIMPLAFCYAGLDPQRRYYKSPALRTAIERLGAFLVDRFDQRGEFRFNSHGYEVTGVEQRLTYAWIEALRMLREAGGDFAFDAWGDKIRRACDTLIEDRLRRLVAARRFIVRLTGTGINHVALFLTTVYRTGQVLGLPRLMEFALPIARAFAADIHPDGYWEEHSDILRNGGPTLLYNYLSHNGMALMLAWTGEQVFAEAVARSAAFFGNFCHPDGTPVALFDERVRQTAFPMIWGLHGMSFTPQGRGAALRHFSSWLPALEDPHTSMSESMARMCENFLYWHEGTIAPAPFEQPGHRAALTLPAALFRHGKWCIALSAMRAFNPEDTASRENPFALDRQKLLSIWHEDAGVVLDGSPSKNQPENSTFATPNSGGVHDYFPIAGTVGQATDDPAAYVVRATYKSFLAEVLVRVVSDATVEIEFSVDAAAAYAPITAGFTLHRRAEALTTANGAVITTGAEEIDLTGAPLADGVTYGPVHVRGPAGMHLRWPLRPYNSYQADHVSEPGQWQVRLCADLTRQSPRAVFAVSVGACAK